MWSLTDWKGKLDNKVRRKCFFEKTPKGWKEEKRILVTALNLEKISKKLKTISEKKTAKRDSDYFYNKLKELNTIGR